MITEITFHTNLDLAQEFIPNTMGITWEHVPAKGARIEFSLPPMFGHKALPQVMELEVIGVRYSATGAIAKVELHIPSYDKRSIAEWEKWMKHRLGRE